MTNQPRRPPSTKARVCSVCKRLTRVVGIRRGRPWCLDCLKIRADLSPHVDPVRKMPRGRNEH